jgi:hypothetical protein
MEGKFMLVQPNSGMIMSVATDPVYALDVDNVPSPLDPAAYDMRDLALKYGYRVDNYNLTSFFYGG